MGTDPFDATMIPALPCPDVDAMRDFWVALGLEVTYRQQRPNPYVSLRRGGFDLHYFGMDGVAPEDSYSTCIALVDDTAAVFATFAAGLRERYGRLPLTGVPRITRPRRRANAGGASGFSVVDPAGNWVRVMRRPSAVDAAAVDGTAVDSTTVDGTSAEATATGRDDSAAQVYAARPPGKVARAVDDAVVQADSHGDPVQARRILAGALRRSGEDASDEDRVRAIAYLAELALRTDDPAAARAALDDLDVLSAKLDPAARVVVGPTLADAAELRSQLP
ncbi:hypothetical protein [Cellulosimicrobium marinum]|uniref:hypothetical protein n=1 Tax=Cellulosimicrobium marinum TaxID=1638992 RepID=UPI001E61FC82|nr:hypothetical protein [Cellulosimicrobium marinum]MCB7135501.1 hypothetical protein [Cellulosimicrobium marinum]